MTRRTFFGTMVAGAASGLIGAGIPIGAPRLKIGVISDIHVSVPAKGGRSNNAKLIETLEFFKKNGVDGVIIAGDLTNYGLMKELRAVAEAWYSVFPNDRDSDGKKVERIFVTGNHDAFYYGWQKGAKRARTPEAQTEGLLLDVQKNWRELFNEPYEPIYLKTIKGYAFIGAHWNQHFDGKLDSFLAEHSQLLNSGKPFFYIQHAHPQNTIFGPWAWGSWDDRDGAARKALGKYPNAVAFSGHSHWSLTDERDVWQGEFTSVGTSSLSYVGMPHGRENGGTEASGYFRRMPTIPAGRCQQGMLMSVWDGAVVLERWDFARFEKLDEDWVLPVLQGPSDEREYSFSARAAQTKAPQFPAGEKLRIAWTKGKDAKGAEEDRMIVTFPSPKSTGWRDRIFDYEVKIEVVEDDTVRTWATKRVYPQVPFCAVKHIPPTANCVFGACELPAIKRGWAPDPYLLVTVTPFNCFGKAGKPLTASYNPV
jgi:predicted phosphodiesterase